MRLKKLCLMLGIMSIVTLNISNVQANTAQKKNEVDSKIQSITREKNAGKKKLQDAINQKNSLKKKENNENYKYTKFLSEKEYIEREEKLLDNAIKEAEDRYNKQLNILKKRIRVMYKNSNTSYIRAMAESKSVSEFLGRVKVISKISRSDKMLMESINNDKLDIEFKKRQKEIEKNNVIRKANETKRNMEMMQTSRAKVDNDIKNLQSRLKRLEREEDELIRKSNELANEIKGLQGNFGKYSSGKMLWPLPSSRVITSPFGTRIHPIFKTNKTHHGVDIAGNMGSPVLAAKDGKVIIAGWQGGYGNAIIIDHGGGITTVYAHCSKLIAKVGQNVKQGEVIAKVGSTGYSTGPHLHFEVRNNGKVVNPLDYTK